MLVQEADARRQEKQRNVVDAEEKLAVAEQKLQPLIESERNTKRLLVAKENAFNDSLQAFNKKFAECNRLKNETIQIDESIETSRSEIQSMEEKSQQQMLEIGRLENEVNVKKADYDVAQDTDSKIKEYNQEIATNLQPAADEAQDNIRDSQANKAEQYSKLESLGKQLSNLQDPVKVWQNRILSKDNRLKPMLQGMDWLRTHEAQLRGEGKV